MIETLTFALAVVALLAVPGPTNTLLAASGAAIGVPRSLRLLAFEISGYLVAIGVLIQVVGPLAASHAFVPIVSKLVASLYLTWSAMRLWRDADAELASVPAPASPLRVFVTTLLNPKALIFAFVVFPHGDMAVLAPFVALFSVLVVCIGCGWIGLGNLIARSSARVATPARISRLAAIALGLFATVIASSAVAAVFA
jgi:threonine/homoserine/homoserine lactone efflux protein